MVAIETLVVNLHSTFNGDHLRENGTSKNLRCGIANCPKLKTVAFVAESPYSFYNHDGFIIKPTTLVDCASPSLYSKAQPTIEFFRDCIQWLEEHPMTFAKIELAPAVLKYHLHTLRRHVLGNCIVAPHIALFIEENAVPDPIGIAALVTYIKNSHVTDLTFYGIDPLTLEFTAKMMVTKESFEDNSVHNVTLDCSRLTYRRPNGDQIDQHHLTGIKDLFLGLAPHHRKKLHLKGMSLTLLGAKNLLRMAKSAKKKCGALVLEDVHLIDDSVNATKKAIEDLNNVTRSRENADFVPIATTEEALDQNRERLLLDAITFALDGTRSFTHDGVLGGGFQLAHCSGVAVVSVDNLTHIFFPLKEASYFREGTNNFGHSFAQYDFWVDTLKGAGQMRSIQLPEGVVVQKWAEDMSLSILNDAQSTLLPGLFAQLSQYVNHDVPLRIDMHVPPYHGNGNNNGNKDNGGNDVDARPTKRARIFDL